MKKGKQGLLRVFLVLECIGFVFVYLFGAQGINVLLQLYRENRKLENEIMQLKKEGDQLYDMVVIWKKDSFLKEKLAREQLQMARKDDEIYYLT